MIIVLGLPGSGKSTVLSLLADKSYKRLNYGTLMFEIAEKEYGISSRDEIRKLSPEKQRKVQAAVATFLANEKGKVLLDTHCSISTPSGYLPGLPFPLLQKLKVDALVLIRAPIDEIMKRRAKDPTRKRDADEIGKLNEQDSFNLSLLASYSALSGAPAKIITNKDGKAKEAAVELDALLSQ